jgi:hypothetical protein
VSRRCGVGLPTIKSDILSIASTPQVFQGKMWVKDRDNYVMSTIKMLESTA